VVTLQKGQPLAARLELVNRHARSMLLRMVICRAMWYFLNRTCWQNSPKKAAETAFLLLSTYRIKASIEKQLFQPFSALQCSGFKLPLAT
jgi:hypothetical protein